MTNAPHTDCFEHVHGARIFWGLHYGNVPYYKVFVALDILITIMIIRTGQKFNITCIQQLLLCTSKCSVVKQKPPLKKINLNLLCIVLQAKCIGQKRGILPLKKNKICPIHFACKTIKSKFKLNFFWGAFV